MRDLMADLRAADPFRQGGNRPFAAADRSRFLEALDRALREVAHDATGMRPGRCESRGSGWLAAAGPGATRPRNARSPSMERSPSAVWIGIQIARWPGSVGAPSRSTGRAR